MQLLHRLEAVFGQYIQHLLQLRSLVEVSKV